jgi:hypothetical protein
MSESDSTLHQLTQKYDRFRTSLSKNTLFCACWQISFRLCSEECQRELCELWQAQQRCASWGSARVKMCASIKLA